VLTIWGYGNMAPEPQVWTSRPRKQLATEDMCRFGCKDGETKGRHELENVLK
jgi:hypothetical protein